MLNRVEAVSQSAAVGYVKHQANESRNKGNRLGNAVQRSLQRMWWLRRGKDNEIEAACEQ
jgi:hypothetical protein